MRYIKFTTAQAAVDRSRTAWTAVLGRAKRAQDGTEFLWGVLQWPGVSHVIAAVDTATESRLTSQERSRLLDATATDVTVIMDRPERS